MIERLGSYIKKELSSFLRENIYLEEGTLVSITRVLMDDSLELARVYVSVYPEKFSAEVFRELKILYKDARKFLASRIKRHKIPEIKFIPDRNFDAESKIEKLLKNE